MDDTALARAQIANPAPTCRLADCSGFGETNGCNAEASCRWGEKNKICIAN